MIPDIDTEHCQTHIVTAEVNKIERTMLSVGSHPGSVMLLLFSCFLFSQHIILKTSLAAPYSLCMRGMIIKHKQSPTVYVCSFNEQVNIVGRSYC